MSNVEYEAVKIGLFLVGAPETRLHINRLLIGCIPTMTTLDHEAVAKEFGGDIAEKLLPFYRPGGAPQALRVEEKPGYDDLPLFLHKELLAVMTEKQKSSGSDEGEKALVLNKYGMLEFE